MTGLDLLYKASSGEEVSVGGKGVIIGGGNSAVDEARTTKRLGAEVSLVYHRTRSEMSADIEEIEQAGKKGFMIYILQNI